MDKERNGQAYKQVNRQIDKRANRKKKKKKEKEKFAVGKHCAFGIIS